MTDLERIQSALDEIAGQVDWAVGWLEHLEEQELRFDADSDRPILKAEAERLRAIADAIVPGRVRDVSTGRRWYLSPDDVRQREADLARVLDDADANVAKVIDETLASRETEKDRRRRRDEERRVFAAQGAARDESVRRFLREHGPSTAAEIAEGAAIAPLVGLEPEAMAETTARSIGAKRGRDRRWRLEA
jgi:hypothetical protein